MKKRRFPKETLWALDYLTGRAQRRARMKEFAKWLLLATVAVYTGLAVGSWL